MGKKRQQNKHANEDDVFTVANVVGFYSKQCGTTRNNDDRSPILTCGIAGASKGPELSPVVLEPGAVIRNMHFQPMLTWLDSG